jgi:type VI protein secretion system component VasF
MTPRFAQQVDPIFMHAIDLMESIGRGKQPSAEREKRIINDHLRNAERELSGKAWDLAKYAIVSWIDKSLLAADNWSGRDWWLTNTLEWEHYRSAECHEMFFVKAKEAADLPIGDDALETFYVCAMLGFHGLYGGDVQGMDQERIRLAVRQFNLPPDLTAWVNGVARVIKQRHSGQRSGAEAEPPEHLIVTATPLWSRTRLLWPWLLAVLVAGLCIVVWSANN